MPVAVAVHLTPSADGSHEHIASVKTAEGSVVPRIVVAEQAPSGTWTTRAPDGSAARIRQIPSCPKCTVRHYITTKADDSTFDNLDTCRDSSGQQLRLRVRPMGFAASWLAETHRGD